MPSSPASLNVNEPTRIVSCPTCRKPVQLTPTNKHRPFCSERCRMIDFGGWASETYRIPGERLEDVSSDDIDDVDRA